jgi:hypothetical protein
MEFKVDKHFTKKTESLIKKSGDGDFSSNLSLLISKAFKKNNLKTAEERRPKADKGV